MNFMFPQLDLKWGPFAEGAEQARDDPELNHCICSIYVL